MRSADKLVMLHLDDLVAVVADLKKIYPEAVTSAESVSVNSSGGMAVRTSTISDPTGNAAVDSRRQGRQSNVKKARRSVKTALTALHAALAHATLAAEST